MQLKVSLTSLALVALTSTSLAAQQPSSDKDLLFAAMHVYSLHKSVLGFGTSCKKWDADSAKRIEEGRTKWEKKNAALLARASEVLAKMGTKAQRAKLDADLNAENRALEQKTETAPLESRKQWCKDYPDRLETKFMDPQSQNPMAYQILMESGATGATKR